MSSSFFRNASILALVALSTSAPTTPPSNVALADPNYGPIPGSSSSYSQYTGIQAPFPGNITGAILNTTYGPGAPDDLLFQNLLGAEWVIFSFYQQGAEMFNTTAFTQAGFLNTTYHRLLQIRDNEAGHLRIFQDQISTDVVKPGPCSYEFPFSDATTYLSLQILIEVSSMAFVSGLEYEAMTPAAASVLVAISETETRHNTWSLIDVWNASPFAGPVDTVFPYANQLLEFTKTFIVPGSCPAENPIYPNPPQTLATFTLASNTTSIAPGSHVQFSFTDSATQPCFMPGRDYYAVFFHGIYNTTMPFNTTSNSTTIPADFEALGIIIAVLADEEGAPTNLSVVAGPATILEYPAAVGLAEAIG